MRTFITARDGEKKKKNERKDDKNEAEGVMRKKKG